MDRAIEKSGWQKNRVYFIITAIVLLSAIGYYKTFISNTNSITIAKSDVKISAVSDGIFHDYISYQGYVEPIRTIYLDAVEGGIIEEVYIEEGTFVNKGDEILRLSNTDLHLSIMNSEAALAEQINRLRDTKLATEQQYLNLKNQVLEQKYTLAALLREYERNVELYKEGYISKEEFLQSKENFSLAKEKYQLLKEKMSIDSLNRIVQISQLSSSLQRMNENLELVQNKLKKLVVKAPVSGQLGTLNAEIGQAISRGQRLGIINDLSSFKVRMQIDEHYVGRITKGQTGNINNTNIDYLLTVRKVYPEIKGGTFEVDLVFKDSVPPNIRAGLSYRVKLEMSEPEKGVIVNKGSFFQETAGKWVFVLKENDRKAIRQNISIGKQNMNDIQITSGLQPGDQIIASNYSDYRDVDIIYFE